MLETVDKVQSLKINIDEDESKNLITNRNEKSNFWKKKLFENNVYQYKYT